MAINVEMSRLGIVIVLDHSLLFFLSLCQFYFCNLTSVAQVSTLSFRYRQFVIHFVFAHTLHVSQFVKELKCFVYRSKGRPDDLRALIKV